jgi:hypothetical protein
MGTMHTCLKRDKKIPEGFRQPSGQQIKLNDESYSKSLAKFMRKFAAES